MKNKFIPKSKASKELLGSTNIKIIKPLTREDNFQIIEDYATKIVEKSKKEYFCDTCSSYDCPCSEEKLSELIEKKIDEVSGDFNRLSDEELVEVAIVHNIMFPYNSVKVSLIKK